jgi:DNA-damage-inducible protein J
MPICSSKEIFALYFKWFRAKVREALDDSRPAIPRSEVESHFAKRRATALRKAGNGEA